MSSTRGGRAGVLEVTAKPFIKYSGWGFCPLPAGEGPPWKPEHALPTCFLEEEMSHFREERKI